MYTQSPDVKFDIDIYIVITSGDIECLVIFFTML